MLYIVDSKDEKTARKAGKVIGTVQVEKLDTSNPVEGKAGTGGKLYARVVPTFTLNVKGEAITFGNKAIAIYRSAVELKVNDEPKEEIAFTV